MKRLIVLPFIAAALCVGWYIASPWLAMRGIVDAARSGQAAELEERVDFAAIRENLKGDIGAAVERQLPNSENPVERFGGAIATGLGGMAVDAAVTPSGLAALVLTGRFAGPLIPEDMRQGQIEWEIDRDGFETFAAHGRFEDGRAGPTLHFRRDGLGWNLVDVDLTDSGFWRRR